MQEIQERPCGATGETIVQTALAAGFPKNQSVACEARHAPTGLRAGRAPCAHARPAPCVAFFVSLAVEDLSLRAYTVSFVISKTHWQSFSVVPCEILCAPLCSKNTLAVLPAAAGP